MISYGLLRLSLVEAILGDPDIWQTRFLRARELDSFARDRAAPFVFDTAMPAWVSGLLLADFVAADNSVRATSMGLPPTSHVGHYADCRSPLRADRGRGLVEAFVRESDWPLAVEPFFHPFRIYVLFRLAEAVEPARCRSQLLLSRVGWMEQCQAQAKQVEARTATPHFWASLIRWNATVDLAVAAAPPFLETILQQISFTVGKTPEIQRSLCEQHWARVAPLFRELPLNDVAMMRRDLSRMAETLDPNHEVHYLLRYARGDARLRSKGALGAALTLLTMSELLRRAVERAQTVELPEEDEMGFTHFIPGAKLRVYGSHRLADSTAAVKEALLQHTGLRDGVRVRVYAEGATECGLLNEALHGFTGGLVQVLNLDGPTLEGKGKGLSFAENLRHDMAARQFSVVCLDGDNTDLIRTLKKAAADEQMFGAFEISQPDVEVGNFDLGELETLLWDILSEKGVASGERVKLTQAVSGASDNKGLFKAARDAFPVYAADLCKNEAWGRRMARLALTTPKRAGGIDRPIVRAVEFVRIASQSSYSLTRQSSFLDAATGKLCRRSTWELAE